jgi:hypothetical protein
MAKKIIRTGTTADPTGDSLKNAFTKVNDNFTELYNALGLDSETLNLGAFEFTGSIITTTDSSSIVLGQDVIISSNLIIEGDLTGYISLAKLKEVVAASNNFTDFQSKIAGL